MDMERFERELAALGDTIEVRRAEPMAAHTTFQIGGAADVFVLPHSVRALLHTLRAARMCGVPAVLIGRGSNLLAADDGVCGAVVCTCAMNGLRVQGTRLYAEAGVTLAALAQTALRQGLTGLEFAAGIPGTVGGGVFMNAGAYGGQLADAVTRTLYADGAGRLHTVTGAAHGFGYRESIYRQHPDWTILGAEFVLTEGDAAEIRAKMEDFAARRRDKQPLNYPSAGSTFKRPAGYFAGALIEQAGMKGAVCGGAQVSEKHAGFIINRGGATCADVAALIERVQKAVRAQSGVTLECEVRRIGG